MVDEASLRQMLLAKEAYEQGYETKFSKALQKLNMGLNDIGQLEQVITLLQMPSLILYVICLYRSWRKSVVG